MEKLIADNRNALRFLLTEDLYVVEEKTQPAIQTEQISKNPTNQVSAPDPLPEERINVNFNYLGENNRYFLIVVDDESHPELNTPHKEMLMKIMGAKKLELRDLAILNLAKYPGTSIGQLKEFFSCSKVALFGIAPQIIGLPAIGANEPTKHLDIKILATFSLAEMSTNTDKKREFWNVMKDF